MDSETDHQQEEADAMKFQSAMMLRYRPQAGRADRHSGNIPGNFTSMGAGGDHTIGHGGGN
jgi:hypothetical protein